MGDESQEYDPGQGIRRSETMSLVQLYVPLEAAHATVEELGELKRVIEFRDLNADVNPFQRTFVDSIRRIEELARQLRFLKSKISSFEVRLRPVEEAREMFNGRAGALIIDELEVILKELEERISTMVDTHEDFRTKETELGELQCVLRETAIFFEQAKSHTEEIRSSSEEPTAPLLENAAPRGEASEVDSGYENYEPEFVAGTIPQARIGTLQRVLWRVLRGNLYMNFTPIEKPFHEVPGNETDEKWIRKSVFIVFTHGSVLLEKVRKISESLGAKVYDIPPDAESRSEVLQEVTSRLEDLTILTRNTELALKEELGRVAESYTAWSEVVGKEKRIYETLNGWHLDRSTLIAEGWVPKRDIPRVNVALDSAKQRAGLAIGGVLSEVPPNDVPPTFHRTNKFTEGFQSIIDAYGVASYQEMNPALYAIITFPFLFAIMFGDIGHGFIMAFSAAILISLERKYPKGFGDEITGPFWDGRYIILLMGLFAMFTGFMYNDILGLHLYLASSGWRWPTKEEGKLVKAEFTGRVYPFGVDPAWQSADNSLVFLNSLKMKLSVIIAVIHMTFAICLQVPNFLHFNKKLRIYSVFLPQIIFIEAIFGYLVFAIFYKWSIDWNKEGRNPPSLLNMLIYMFLSPGYVPDNEQLYPGQGVVQAVLLTFALICIPWLLCLNPFLEWREHRQKVNRGYREVSSDEDGDGDITRPEDELYDEEFGQHAMHPGEKEDEFEMGDVIIHQVIHTIEYCLGCVSNTASYLRLWALSLAHAELSEVLWLMTIQNAFHFQGFAGVVITFIGFAVWFFLTIGIMVFMEGLSAFLHALRLHWVESNGKHYEAAGRPFQPLSFEGCSADVDG